MNRREAIAAIAALPVVASGAAPAAVTCADTFILGTAVVVYSGPMLTDEQCAEVERRTIDQLGI